LGAPVQSESGGGTDPARSAGKFFGRVPLLFGSKNTISRFGERFRDGQYSLVSFMFAVHGAPRAQLFVKVRGHVPPPRAPWSRRHCKILLFA